MQMHAVQNGDVKNISFRYTRRMNDFHAILKKHGKISEQAQVALGKAKDEKMTKKHNDFLKDLLSLINEGKINPMNPESFINKKIYDTMPQEWKAKVDLGLINMAHMIQKISEFYQSKDTPNASPELQNMIEHLWLMKQRIEEKYDAFKF